MKTNSYTSTKEIKRALNIELITGAIFFAALLAGLLYVINLIPSAL